MKFTISKDQHPAFLRACRLAETVAITRTNLPVLSAVLLTTQKRSVTIQANNLDEAVVAEFDADIVQNGQCAVMGRDLARIGALSATFELEAKEKGVTIKCGGTFKLAIFPPEDFPKLPEMGKVKSVAMTAGELTKALSVIYAASTDSARYVLNGVFLDVAQKIGVAADGRRLALSTLAFPKTFDGQIVPDKACKMLLTIAKDGKGKTFEVKMGTSTMCVETDEFSFYSKLIEGNFPNFQQVIAECPHGVSARRDEVLAALEKFAFIEWDTRKVQLVLDKTGGSINGTGKQTSAEVSFSYADDSGFEKEISIGLDPAYFQSAVAAMNVDIIRIEYSDSLSNVVVKGDSYALVVPMRCA